MTEILSWGNNNHGQLGDQSLNTSLEPISLEAFRGTSIKQISAGAHHSMAVTELGDVYIWGRATEGQWGNGMRTATPLEEDATKRAPQLGAPQKCATANPTRVHSLRHERISQVQAGNFHSLALTIDGRLYEFGRLYRYDEEDEADDRFGSAISLPGAWARRMLQHSHRTYYSAGVAAEEIEESHQVTNFGAFRPFISAVPRLVPGLERVAIRAMAAGYSFNVAVAQDGRCFSWGYNERFQLGLGDRFNRAHPCKITFPPSEDAQEPRISAVACGEQHLLCLSRSGIVYSCGLGVFGQLGHGSKRDERRPKAIAAFADEALIVQISCGAHHSAALDATGQAWLWGHAEYSQMGGSSAQSDWGGGDRGSGSAFPLPKPFAFFSQAEPRTALKQIACGDLFTLALTANDEVFGWGWNQSGALGMGNRRFLQQPSQVMKLQGEAISSISAGGVHALAINASANSLFGYDFKDYVGSSRFSDITFSVQKVDVPAHKIVVFLRCPHLAAQVALTERYQPQRAAPSSGQRPATRFELPGVKVHVFRALLGYLYTDHLKCTPHWLEELRELAVRYRLPHLAHLCSRQMTRFEHLQAFDQQHRVASTFAQDLARGMYASQHADVLLGIRTSSDEIPFKSASVVSVVEGEPWTYFYAHKIILAARCAYFKKLWDGHEEEEGALAGGAKQQVIQLSDLSDGSLSILLRYLYSGDESAVQDPELQLSLLIMSDRFMLNELKQACELSLQEVISYDNVGCLLILADRYAAPRLRKACLNFLKIYWTSLMNSDAMLDIKTTAPHLVDIVDHYVKFCPLPLDQVLEGTSNSS